MDFFNCNINGFQGAGMVLSGLLTGLVGSVTHCSGMCGPFAVTQSVNNNDYYYSKNSENGSFKFGTFERLKGAALLPYHAGRIFTYTMLAVIATYASSSFFTVAGYKKFSIVAMVISAIFLLSILFPQLGSKIGLKSRLAGNSFISKIISKSSKNLFLNPRGANGFILGVLLGLMPCALVFSAIFFAVASGSAFNAAKIMIAFGLGTVPALFFVAYGGGYFQKFFKTNKVFFTKTAATLSLVALLNFVIKIL